MWVSMSKGLKILGDLYVVDARIEGVCADKLTVFYLINCKIFLFEIYLFYFIIA